MAEPRFPGYRVVEELGSGTLSTIYKATQDPIGRTVAIKSLKPTISPSSPFATQLVREARVLGDLSHAGIVLLYDFVRTDTQMYLVLEHVDGWTMSELLKKRRAFSPEVVAAIGIDLAEALAHAHDRGVVHRDVKPSNVLLSRRGETKLIDFGIAQRDRLPSADEPLVHGEHGAYGTPAYMSPEQLLGDEVDARSDLFSLGVLLYQMACGTRPYERDAKDKRVGDRMRPAIPLRDRAPEVPRELERIVMRLIEKSPADRYASAEIAAEQLSTYLRSVTRETRSAITKRALVEAGLVKSSQPAPAGRTAPKRRADLRSAWLGFAAIGGLFVLAIALVQWRAWGNRSALRAGAAPLALAPTAAGHVRVVATPWAEVFVDGERIDVTPFARAVPLAPGVHYVTFKHPSAPDETRTIRVVEGETQLVDVTMRVDGASGDGGT